MHPRLTRCFHVGTVSGSEVRDEELKTGKGRSMCVCAQYAYVSLHVHINLDEMIHNP